MKYIPTYIVRSVYDIDFAKLYAKGKRIILFDLDNTLAPYDEHTPSTKVIQLITRLKELGFSVYLVSNNNKKRIGYYTNDLAVQGYIYKANKPFTYRIARYFSKHHIVKEEVIAVGDQLVTDVFCFNRLGFDNILVKTINVHSQKWYTNLNRIREKRIMQKMKKVDYNKYSQIKELYE